MSSKKVSMVMMLAVMAMVLMADFLTCHDQNMNVNGNSTEPNYHHHRSRHLGHDHDEYYDPHGHGHYSNSNNNKRMEGGVPHLDAYPTLCRGDLCDPVVQGCALHCACLPIYLILGRCDGTCCSF